MTGITFGSVCSGIEAASVAWHPLGWRAAWLAEIEPFPCAVLAHHYPDVPNLGDMNTIPQRLRNGDIAAPDVFCGGTPCQAFSVAGLRNSLDDARGNLSLKFCDIANEIDIQRAAAGLLPAIVFWENVPGVLSTKDNAFGCFLGQLAGEDCPLIPAGGKWSNAGAVLGPQRAIAWRVLDAQYFGVAQRRRRVFVVASAREGFDPAAVLFEFDGVRRDSAPRREQGQDAAGTLASRTDGGGFPRTDEACSGYVQPVGWPAEVAPTLNAAFGSKLGLENQHIRGGRDYSSPQLARCLTTKTRIDAETETLIPTIGGVFSSEVRSVALRGRDGGATAELGDEVAGCLRASTGGGDKPHVLAPLAFDPTQITHPANRSNPRCGDPCHTLAKGARAPAVTYAIQAGALRTNPNSGPDGMGVQPDIAYTMEARAEVQAVCVTGEIAHTAKAEGLGASEDGGGIKQPITAVCREVAQTITSNYGKQCDNSDTALGPNVAIYGMAVRRLMPVECERLQGFPDGYTDIPWTEYQRLQKRAAKHGTSFEAELRKRGKILRGPEKSGCPDGPRYKALGNSWAVPNVRWIGVRIDAQLRALQQDIKEAA